MDVSSRTLYAFLSTLFTRKVVTGNTQFYMSVLSNDNVASLTRINSIPARRVKVKSFTALKSVRAARRFTLKNGQSVQLVFEFNSTTFGTPMIRLTWFEAWRRFETHIEVQTVGFF
jgi:hypothetical protein